jgi:quercetin 2,3-dioxygenase
MSKPHYQSLTKAAIPVVNFADGGYARIIAGELNGTKGPANTFTPINLWDVGLKAGERVELQLPEGHNASVVLRKGDVTINRDSAVKGEVLIAVLSPEGESIVLEAKADTSLVILTGEPILEPVASYGPFVMNTREEIIQAVKDFESGRFGQLK